ncbi:MAG: M28 family peptidase, partial [Pirellulaceae bacterium]
MNSADGAAGNMDEGAREGAARPGVPAARRPRYGLPCVLISGWALLIALCALAYRGPAPRGEDAPPDEFSAARAVATLRRVLGDEVPHPVGSEANGVVRERLVAELESLGLEVELHRTEAYRGDDEDAAVIPLTNVLARFPRASSAGQPLLLVTHHDSSPYAPGAGDAGSGMAALLETARALRGTPLPRPVYLLFTDGEEYGLLGAQRFVAEHPLMAERPFVLNFDARGDSGASLMYETHSANRSWVAWAASRLPRPCGTGSAFVTVYRLLPNNTDFTHFAAAGLQGANFANIGSVHRYHTPLDTIANLDPRTVQHHGENALTLTRELLHEAPEAFADEEDAVFFDVVGQWIVWYPNAWAIWLAVAPFLVLSVGQFLRWRDPQARGSSGRVVLAAGLTVAWSYGLGMLLGMGASQALIDARATLADMPAIAWTVFFMVLVWITSIGGTVWLAGSLLRRAAALDVWWTVWCGWSAVALLTAAWLPGFSHYVTWPAMAAALVSWHPHVRVRVAAPVLVAGVLLVPLLYLLPIA